MQTVGAEAGQYLGVFGLYVLQPDIFEYLDSMVSSNIRTMGQFPLTPCLDRLRKEMGLNAYLVDGDRLDIGFDTASYIRALSTMSQPRPSP
jgi:UTP--glucose-1-phosphate uridylyltransferase